jgi:predicted transcriptional regulator
MDETLIDRLTGLGFTAMEARVYCALVAEGDSTGYQIARSLNAARSSVYPALDSLSAKGLARLIPGEPNAYAAVDPDEAIGRMRDTYAKNADSAREGLSALAKKGSVERFVNIAGKENLLAHARSLIDGAAREVVLNCTMPLEPLAESFRRAAERGVRVIMFSWKPLDVSGIPVEFFCAFDGTDVCAEERLMLVADASRCLIGSNDTSALVPHRAVSPAEKLPSGDGDFLGMTSDNRLMVNVVLEHIHFDIYLLKLRARHGEQLIDGDIQIGSLMEKGI